MCGRNEYSHQFNQDLVCKYVKSLELEADQYDPELLMEIAGGITC